MPTLEINGNLVTDITLGGQDVIRINHAVSGVLLWEKPAPPVQSDYLCFTAGQANSTVSYTSSLSTPPTIYKSTDKTNWTAWDGTSITLANVGDKIYLYGENTNVTGESLLKFSMTGEIAASGDCTRLLSQNGYSTIPSNAFYAMFRNCTALTTPPEITATTIERLGCSSMFWRCSNLTAAPALPATTLATACYDEMFYDCTSMTTGPSVLPATTLASSCYENMFGGCSAMTTAPELMATQMASSCYQSMFARCSSLESVKVHVSVWDSTNSTNWLYNGAASGTIYAPTGSDIANYSGVNGVPAGWTVSYY